MRSWYVCTAEPVVAYAMATAVLDAVRPYAHSAEARPHDALDAAPAEVTSAWQSLAEPRSGWQRLVARWGRPVRVNAADDQAWEQLAACAPWCRSIDVMVDGQVTVARVTEQATTAVMHLPMDAASALAARLEGVAELRPLNESAPWWRFN